MDAVKELFTGKKDKKEVHIERKEETTLPKANDLPANTNVSAQSKISSEVKTSSNVSSAQQAACGISSEAAIAEAQKIKEQACRQLAASEQTFQSAQAAQEQVARAAANANIITNQALHQEVAGQKKLVEAGQKLMEAGAQLQQEAAGRTREVETNIIQKGAISQQTGVEVPNIPASEMHILQNRMVSECRPVMQQQVRTETIGHTYQHGEAH